MGLLDRLRGIKDPVEGTYRLVACSSNSGGAVYENCSMDGVVEGPGVPATAVHHSTLAAPTAKWPQPGSVLPVEFERTDPSRLRIRWDRVPTNAQVAAGLAQQAAQQAASPAPSASVPGGRPMPGSAGGGLTPEESARAAAGDAAAVGLVPLTARVLAAHPVPEGAGAAPGGVWDLTLDVAGSPGWSSVLRIGFSSEARRQAIAQVGRELPVLADPVRHDRIAVDVSRLV